MKDSKMRLNLTHLCIAAIAVLAIPATHAQAQSGSRLAPPSSVLGGLAPSIQAPNIQGAPVVSLPMSAAPMVNAPMLQSPIVGSQMIQSPMVTGTSTQLMTSPTFSTPQFGQPSFAQASPGFASNGPVSTGPVTVGPYPQACGHCNQRQFPTEIPRLKPVTSCCGQLGRLGIPPLTTPLRADTPPIGKANGRPLIGRWNGF